MAREITISIFDDDTPTKIEVKGVKGEGCKALTKPLEQAFGTVTRDSPTDEMYEKVRQKEGVRERGSL